MQPGVFLDCVAVTPDAPGHALMLGSASSHHPLTAAATICRRDSTISILHDPHPLYAVRIWATPPPRAHGQAAEPEEQ